MRGRFSTIDRVSLTQMIEEEKMTQRKAAEKLGVSLSAVERACKRWNIKTQRTGPRRGSGHPNWKGGRILVGGYVYLFDPNHPMATQAGYVAEHRKIVSDRVGRPLTEKESVHHIDGDKQNNAPDNLMLFATNAEHLKHELSGRIPNWTDEGWERILEGVAKSATLRRSKPHGLGTPQKSDR